MPPSLHETEITAQGHTRANSIHGGLHLRPTVAWRRFPKRARIRRRHIAATVNDVSWERPEFGGMTVNERLVTAGLIGQFDAAIDAGDRHRAMDLLRQVAMSESSAAATVDAVLADPSRCGYPRPD
jgi:hypothetical protein